MHFVVRLPKVFCEQVQCCKRGSLLHVIPTFRQPPSGVLFAVSAGEPGSRFRPPMTQSIAFHFQSRTLRITVNLKARLQIVLVQPVVLPIRIRCRLASVDRNFWLGFIYSETGLVAGRAVLQFIFGLDLRKRTTAVRAGVDCDNFASASIPHFSEGFRRRDLLGLRVQHWASFPRPVKIDELLALPTIAGELFIRHAAPKRHT